jgi:mono/diheme cytochrome c family protein
MKHLVLPLVILGGALSGVLALAQTRTPNQAPSFALLSLTGRDSFDRYCATCHGVSGKGDGPVGASLKARPADLTTLARRSGGAFPRAEVLAFIDGTGRQIPAHGPTEMPLWGGIFRWLDSEARTKVRLNNLVAYVESLQVHEAAVSLPPALNGEELFRTYCANCHGRDGRGDGVMAGQLRRDPPDLTTFAMRNRGAFPADRLRRIIDGLEVAAHGNRTMPVWGDVFSRQPGGGRDTAAARIDALVRYIQSIQERPAE